MPVTVTAIHTTPVKGLHLHAREEVRLEVDGVADDRRFYLIDAQGRLVNNKTSADLMAVSARWSPEDGELSLLLPDGRRHRETVVAGSRVATTFFGRTDRVATVCPQLSEVLSRVAGQPLRLVRADPEHGGVDRGRESVVSVISRGSLAALSERAGEPVDGRRFRMLLEVDGLEPHGEDAWVGARLSVGGAEVAFSGHIGRCRVTQMDPDTGETTLGTLKLLGYRRDLDTTEPLAFGIYGAVLAPGRVRVGDPVALLGPAG